MNPVRIGIVGCGDFALRAHIPNLLRDPAARITALADVDPGRRERATKLAPVARAYQDFRDLLESSDVDAVLIALPNAMHAEAAVAAFSHGLHVYLEKPLATTGEDGQRVLTAWRRSGRIGMIGLSYRFHPLYRQARDIVRSGAIGHVVSLQSTYSSAQHTMPSWKRSRVTGGGALLDLFSHEADLIRFVTGRNIVEVSARVRNVDCDCDSASIQLRLDDGTLSHSTVALLAVERAGMLIIGDGGSVEVDRYGGTYARVRRVHTGGVLGELRAGLRELAGLSYMARKHKAPMNQPAFTSAMQAFVAALRAGEPTGPDLDDGWHSLAAVLAADESDRLGGAVPIHRGHHS